MHLGRLMGPVGFSRTVAIKRLHEAYASDPEFVAMFLDEARIVARIRHPNVVPTLDVVALEKELLIVMEYISGASLSLLLRRARELQKPPPIPVVADVMIGVLHGLHAAHEATSEKGEPLGIVHRDVSPQNIVVGTDGIPRVLDFGVAKAVGRMHQTREGQIKGKIQYMPPEQVTGASVTRTADVYAASIVLWEALSGRRFFDGESDVEVMYRVVEGTAAAPSTVRPEIPAALDAVVLRGLEKDPADRYQTAMAMANALEAVVPAVTRSAVESWVREMAGAELSQRAQRVSEVESDPSPIVGAPPSQRPGPRAQADEPGAQATLVTPVQAPTLPTLEVGAATPSLARVPEPDEGAPSVVGRPPPGRLRSSRVLAAAVAVVAAVGSGAIALWGRRPPSPASATAISTAAAATVQRSSSDRAAEVAAATAPAPASAVPSASASVTPPAAAPAGFATSSPAAPAGTPSPKRPAQAPAGTAPRAESQDDRILKRD